MNFLKTGFLLAAMTVLLVFTGRLIGGSQGAALAFGFALLMNFGAYWFSDKMVLAMYRAKPLSQAEAPQVFRAVQDIALQNKMPMPKLFLVPTMTPNAFATGRSPKHASVAVTSGILQVLDEQELKGVLAHELSHVKNRDTLVMTIAAAVAGAISMVAQWARWSMFMGGGRRSRDDDRGSGGAFQLVALLFIVVLAPIAAMLIQLAISRTREYDADETGAKLIHNPFALASALQKLDAAANAYPMQDVNPATAHLFIVNPLRSGLLASLFSTHPPMEKRIERLKRLRV